MIEVKLINTETGDRLTVNHILSVFEREPITENTYHKAMTYFKEIEQKELCLNRTTPELCKCKSILFNIISQIPQDILDKVNGIKHIDFELTSTTSE
jgi:hypothetical protein